MSDLANKILEVLEQDEHIITLDLASKLQTPEGLILKNLPSKWITVLPGEQAKEILQEVATWGKTTTIIEKDGLIIEVSGNFPNGIDGHGYYNLNMGPMADSSIALSGHLKMENITDVVLLSKPFRGKESYAICFVTNTGNCGFKIYLGRDENRRLFPEQVAKFKALAGLE